MKITKFTVISCFIILIGLEMISSKTIESTVTDKKKKKKEKTESVNNNKATTATTTTTGPLEKAIIKGKNEAQISVAYNYEKNNAKNELDTLTNGVKPLIVDHLPAKNDSRYGDKIEKISPIFIGDEKSNTDYYDGLTRMNAFKTDCSVYSDKDSCLLQSHCGFCEDNNTCIPGDKSGPIKSCKNFRYFGNPSK